MRITRNVITDLLPLYTSGEASDDTTELVREYLESDPELADMARDAAAMKLPDDAPVPLTWEDNMKAYKEAKKLMLIRTIVLAAIISATVLTIFGVGMALIMFSIR